MFNFTPNLALPRVTHILSATEDEESKERLRKWAHKMDKIHGEGGGEMQRQEAADNGTKFHAAIANYIKTEAPPNLEEQPTEQSRWNNALQLIEAYRPHIYAQEFGIQSDVMGYRGTPDALAFKNCPTIIDWKTSKRVKREDWINNYKLQVTAYALACQEHGVFVEEAIICIFSPKRAQRFIVNIDQHREEWLSRLNQFNAMEKVA
jgi:CRISPR/Cas system-associated exonuclease Cas4 (RecB family)